MSETATRASRIDELRVALSEVTSASDVTEYVVDGSQPEIVLAPREDAEASRALAECDALRLSTIPRGGGQHLALGNLPASHDVALSFERMPRMIEHEPADLTATVSAATPLGILQATLAEHGQHLPIDPPCDEARATIGGIIAANAFGPSRHARGTIRDWLLGVRVLLADGTPTKAGGRVVKNVAGYELTKVYTGSLGTLGVITEATFKVAPLPPASASVAATFDSADAAASAALAAWDAGLALSAAEALSPTAASTVLGKARWAVGFVASGGVRAVDRSLRDLGALIAQRGGRMDVRAGSDTWDPWRVAFTPRDVTLRASVVPSQVGSALATLDRRLAGTGFALSATVSAGVIRCVMQPAAGSATMAAIDAARSVIERHGGTMLVECAPPTAKRNLDVFGDLRGDFAIMRLLKEEFDPNRTLSPGRFIGRL